MDLSARRNFLKGALGGIAAAAAAGFIWPIYRYLAPPAQGGAAAKTIFPLATVRPEDAKYFQYQGRAAVLVKKKDGSLVAMSAVCTHLGRVVQWQKDKEEFLCPCHGGRFNTEGKVVGGPPVRPLDKLPVTVANDAVVVG